MPTGMMGQLEPSRPLVKSLVRSSISWTKMVVAVILVNLIVSK